MLARCEAGLAMADGGWGARPFVLDGVREGEDSEATAAAIDGDEARIALGDSWDGLRSCDLVWTFHFHSLVRRISTQKCRSMGPLAC